MKDIKLNEITIIGPGLIGASLGLILKKKIAKKIVWIDVSKKNLKDAIENKSIDEGRQKIDEKNKKKWCNFYMHTSRQVDSIANQIFISIRS